MLFVCTKTYYKKTAINCIYENYTYCRSVLCALTLELSSRSIFTVYFHTHLAGQGMRKFIYNGYIT